MESSSQPLPAPLSLASQLLRTKLYIPPVRPEHVPRPRLTGRLDEGLQCKLTLVSAPAGFGKTTLVSAWLFERNFPAAWISLDAGDNDPARFCRYMIAALQTVAPQAGVEALMLLQSPQLPPLESIWTALVNDLCALPGKVVLVLDDYHLIHAADVHRAVGFLLEHLPPQVHLVLLTRADPSLALARLRARNQLVELRAAHLRFTTAQVAAFLNQAMGLSLSGDDIAALETSTEGWIAGLQLAAIAMQSLRLPQSPSAAQDREDPHRFVTAFTGGHCYIVDYLVDEVLDRQPDPIRSFLLQTSILERLSGPLCNAVAQRTDGQATLRALEQANLFVVPLDGERHWYRYHHLFAEALRSCLHETYPDRLPELHHRAAEWYERNGLVAEAIDHALAAGDRDLGARLVESNARPTFMRGELVTLENWLQALGEIVHDRPWLSIHRVWTLILTGQMEAGEELLQQVERHISGDWPRNPAERQDLWAQDLRAQDLRGEIAAMRGLIAYYRGDIPQAAQFCRQALAGLREDNDFVRALAALALGVASKPSGDLAGAIQAHAQAARLAKGTGSILLAVSALTCQGDALIEQARLHQAVEVYNEALQLATLPNEVRLPAAGKVFVCLAKVLYEWNDLGAAAQSLQQGIELSRLGGMVEHLTVGHFLLARARQAQGDLGGAQEAVQEAERMAIEHSLPAEVASSVRAGRVRLWLAQGNVEEVSRWAEQSGLAVDDPVSYIREPEYMILLHVLLALGDPDAALTLANRLLHAAEAAGRTGRVILFLALQALAWQATENVSQALAVLERALSLAQPEGYVRTFLDEGAPMIRLLRHAASRGIAPGYVTQLLSGIVEAPGVAPSLAQPLIEPLSERELEVLRLLAAGRSNREIADELVLATGTVKRHLYNIYGKLNVPSRLQCVARAQELHLL